MGVQQPDAGASESSPKGVEQSTKRRKDGDPRGT
jgi:hypothetical protein